MASPDAASLAADMGYSNVYVFRGGLPEWIQAGYETVTVEKLPKADAPAISVSELEKILAGKQEIVLLDVRPGVEAAKMHIDTPYRKGIPFEDIDARYSEIPKGKKIIIIDVNGKRSSIASKYLNLKGYSDLARVDGGMNAWVQEGKPFKK